MVPGKKPLTHETIFHGEVPPLVWDVEGLVSRGDRVVVYGEFGSGKSWIAQHLALHLAAGRPWLEYPIPEVRRVLYIDEEMNPRTTWRRLKRLTVGMGLQSPVPLTVLSRGGVLFNQNGASEVLGWMKGNRVEAEVVFIDAMRRVIDGDENLAADVTKFWRNLEKLAQERTIIVIHHMNKPPRDTVVDVRHRASGSTDILAGSDASLALTKEGQGLVTVEGVKARDAAEAEAFMLRWGGPIDPQTGKEDPQGPITVEKYMPKAGAPHYQTWGKGVETCHEGNAGEP